jgi:hypothetical protein
VSQPFFAGLLQASRIPIHPAVWYSRLAQVMIREMDMASGPLPVCYI